MHLWTDYEGNTLAGYPLGRLTRSEGRSAFFLTTTPDGAPALLRLTESHFDDSELIHRWQKIAAVKHPNLQAIAHSGQITFDDVPLACCLLEPVDTSLSDVLRERPLTVDEAKEVAESVAGALTALHAAGLIHEHIDATNVFAYGEIIKLRSDCARECLGDFEADTAEARTALRQRDIRDLGLLLLRCLGLEWQGNTAAAGLPAPFHRILPGALDGTLTADSILHILKPPPIAAIPAPVARPTPAAAVRPTPAAASPAQAAPRPATAPTRPTSVSARTVPATPAATSPDAVLQAITQRGTATPTRKENPFDVGIGKLRNHSQQPVPPRKLNPETVRHAAYVASGAAAILLAAIVWTNTGSKPAPVTPSAPAAIAAAPVPKPTPSTPGTLLTRSEQAGWRVIAYTYNQQQQAQAKATQIRNRHAALQPQVFTPTGHAPYFVALGGPLDSATAAALRNRARHDGLPRDTYTRNF